MNVEAYPVLPSNNVVIEIHTLMNISGHVIVEDGKIWGYLIYTGYLSYVLENNTCNL